MASIIAGNAAVKLPEATSEHRGHLVLPLTLPDHRLHPNANHGNRYQKSSLVKQRRASTAEYAFAAALELLKQRPKWRQVVVEPVFYFKDRRGRDSDNLTAWLKSTMDGCVDGGLLADDVGVQWMTPAKRVDKQCPRVELIFRRGRITRVAIQDEDVLHEIEPERFSDDD